MTEPMCAHLTQRLCPNPTAAMTMPPSNALRVPCQCLWHGVMCQKDATQEDGLCDWCGDRRPEDMRDNPFAQWSAEGKYLGLAGGTVTGYNHQAGWDPIPDSVRPTACWMEPRPGRGGGDERTEDDG